MESLIRQAMGEKVSVYYLGDESDEGVLTEYDGECVRLERHKDADLIVPLSSIRIIKVARRRNSNRNLPKPA